MSEIPLDPIQEFLEEQRSDGRYDSTGVFTAEAGKALSKLASYQLPRPSAWVLKMIQAGVAGEALSIGVGPIASGFQIVYRGPHFVSGRELADTWTSPTAAVSNALKHLMVGLRAISVGQRRSVLVTWRPVEGPVMALHWNGIGLSDLQERRTTRLFSQSQDELSFYFSETNDQRGYSWMAEFRELRDYAVSCPVPLTVAEERLDHFGLRDVFIHRKPLLFGDQPSQRGEPCLYLTRPVDDEPDSQDPLRASAWLLYASDIPSRSLISWVQHGVVCQEREFGPKHRFQLRLYVPGDHLDTDLTGLHLRLPNPTVPFEGLDSALAFATDALSARSPRVADVARALNEGGEFGVRTLMGLVVLTSALMTPVLGSLGLGGGCLGAAAVHGLNRAQQQRAIRGFLRDLEGWRVTLSTTFEQPPPLPQARFSR